MNGFLFTLSLQEPVLANSLNGEPNSANSLYYIPGGLIRGAAVNAYGGKKDANDDTFRRLFLNGKTRFLNAYPLSKDGKRTHPTPLKFKKPKYFDASEYSSIEGGKILALEEEWQINVHTQRDAKLGHATTEAGAVYRYIALPAGMTLQGAVITESNEDAETLKTLLNNKSLLLGKARTAGYGHAVLNTDPLGDWQKFASTTTDIFTITLLSPTIVRDEYGQPTLDISHALKTRLGLDALTIEEASQKSEVVGGFNRTWGLPLPQVTALAAGSYFKIEANVDAKKLQALQETGIGERRAEGFGWVAVNLELPESVEDSAWKTISLFTAQKSGGKSKLGENATAKLMVKRLAKRELDQAVIHAAREMAEEYKGNVPNSQLSRWRVITRDVLEKRGENDKRDISRLQKFMEESKGKAGWQKMERARVKVHSATPRLTEWIEDLLKQPDELQKALGEATKTSFSLGTNAFALTENTNVEYRLRLLDAVLAVMAKKNGGSNG